MMDAKCTLTSYTPPHSLSYYTHISLYQPLRVILFMPLTFHDRINSITNIENVSVGGHTLNTKKELTIVLNEDAPTATHIQL